MATRTFTAPSARGSATDSWSRSRESSLSIEDHGSPRRSRMEAAASLAARVMALVSARTAGEKSGSRPRSSIALRAMLLSTPLPGTVDGVIGQ